MLTSWEHSRQNHSDNINNVRISAQGGPLTKGYRTRASCAMQAGEMVGKGCPRNGGRLFLPHHHGVTPANWNARPWRWRKRKWNVDAGPLRWARRGFHGCSLQGAWFDCEYRTTDVSRAGQTGPPPNSAYPLQLCRRRQEKIALGHRKTTGTQPGRRLTSSTSRAKSGSVRSGSRSTSVFRYISSRYPSSTAARRTHMALHV